MPMATASLFQSPFGFQAVPVHEHSSSQPDCQRWSPAKFNPPPTSSPSPTSGETCIGVVDGTKMKRANLDMEFTKFSLGVLKKYYPERLDTCLVVDAGWLYNSAWQVTLHWLSTRAHTQAYVPAPASVCVCEPCTHGCMHACTAWADFSAPVGYDLQGPMVPGLHLNPSPLQNHARDFIFLGAFFWCGVLFWTPLPLPLLSYTSAWRPELRFSWCRPEA